MDITVTQNLKKLKLAKKFFFCGVGFFALNLAFRTGSTEMLVDDQHIVYEGFILNVWTAKIGVGFFADARPFQEYKLV